MSGAGFPATAQGRQNQTFVTARNERADSNPIEEGDALQWDEDEDGAVGVIRPVGAAGVLAAEFAGIARLPIAYKDQRNASIVASGETKCKFLNAATAEPGAYCTPVANQDYLTVTDDETEIILLTDQTDGTAVHGPEEGVNAPRVLIRRKRGFEADGG